jgi:3-hydroxyisobutyrate dehydrogenase
MQAGSGQTKETNMENTIGWLGAGKIGLPMLVHLLRAGHRVAVYEPQPQRMEEARHAGASIAASIQDLARYCNLVFASLPDDEALLSASCGEGGLFKSALRPLTFVDTSTVSPDASKKVADAAGRAGIDYLRVTVSGTPVQAQAAALTVMVSGRKEIFNAVHPFISQWGPNLFYLGEEEQARVMKLIINLMVGATASMMAEAVTLGRKSNLEWKQMLDIIAASAVASPLVKVKAEQLKRRDFSPLFTAQQMGKDLGLVLRAGEAAGVHLPIAAVAAQRNADVVNTENGLLDYFATVLVAEREAGLAPLPEA